MQSNPVPQIQKCWWHFIKYTEYTDYIFNMFIIFSITVIYYYVYYYIFIILLFLCSFLKVNAPSDDENKLTVSLFVLFYKHNIVYRFYISLYFKSFKNVYLKMCFLCFHLIFKQQLNVLLSFFSPLEHCKFNCIYLKN